MFSRVTVSDTTDGGLSQKNHLFTVLRDPRVAGSHLVSLSRCGLSPRLAFFLPTCDLSFIQSEDSSGTG